MIAPDSERLTGTPDRPIEHIPDAPSTWRDWALLLGGPAVWITHFMAVYLAAEVACGPLGPDNWAFFGDDAFVIVTVGATVAAVLACGAIAWGCRRRAGGGGDWKIDFASGGVLLSIGSIIGVVAVGVPAVVLTPVC